MFSLYKPFSSFSSTSVVLPDERQESRLCKRLVARGKPSTMVTAREACRDEKMEVMHYTAPCAMLMNASEFTPLHNFNGCHSTTRTMLEFNYLCTTRVMLQNSKMLDFPCIFRHFSKIFKNFAEISNHIISWNFFHRIFPDMSFGPHQDTISSFRMRDPHPNLTTGSRDMLDFLDQPYIYWLSSKIQLFLDRYNIALREI